jgi:DNA-binding NarL/FixJ family response regulator
MKFGDGKTVDSGVPSGDGRGVFPTANLPVRRTVFRARLRAGAVLRNRIPGDGGGGLTTPLDARGPAGDSSEIRPETETLRVVLIEDDPDDVLILEEALADAADPAISLVHESRLDAGIRRLREEDCSLVLLDLSLPDGRGLGTLRRLRDARPDRPVVVLTGMDDEETALEAVRAGAQDYLVKGRFGDDMLRRAIRYAVERHRLKRRLDAARMRERRERELREMERFAPSGPGESPAGLEDAPLKSRRPGAYRSLVRDYDRLLSTALENQIFRAESDVARGAHELSRRLCGLNARARDVVDLHAEVIQERAGRENPDKSRACMTEGRMLLMRLLGYLADCYRRRIPGEPASGAEEGKAP